ncbi:hypothetical protein [Kyrpidia spormannii]|uniref:Glycosyltransferase RgtA/B/C/D-like domain-containing protein n=1 Tax=Kyrpidia spormannii TaxID=2055160 RepID=A0A6F9E783_9BACL|nr:hypothetical protein [Kyrpidia spormannii]CAB3392383.1 conserved membrane protein of unknown function [Kyrpidia spormannii]
MGRPAAFFSAVSLRFARHASQVVRRFSRGVDGGYAILVFVLATGILLAPPAIGMANNGDFERIMYQPEVGLAFNTTDPHLRYFNWVNRYFDVVGGGDARYPSSLALLLQPAIAVSQWLYGRPLFDLSVLAVFYTALLAVAAFFTLGALRRVLPPWATVFAALAGIVVYCDVAYLAYCRSLYSEAVSFVSFMFLLAFTLDLLTRPVPRIWGLVAFGAAAVAFGTAKLQMAPLALVLGVFAVRLAHLRQDRLWRVASVLCAAVVVGASTASYALTPRAFAYTNLYHSVFDGILVNPATRVQDLQSLHLDARLAVLAGTSYFDRHPIDVRGREFRERFYRKIGWTQIAGFYLTHPDRFIEAMQQSHRAALAMRPPYLGNYERSSGMPAKTLTHRFSVWSDTKRDWFPSSVWVLAGYWLVYVVVAVRGLRVRGFRPVDGLERGPRLAEFALWVGILAVIQFPIPYLAEGRNELVKHLFTYDLLWDTTLLISGSWAIAKIESAIRLRKRQRVIVSETTAV